MLAKLMLAVGMIMLISGCGSKIHKTSPCACFTYEEILG